MSYDEYLDLVEDNDHVIGKKKRSEIYAANLSNFRVVNAFIINSKGELWLPRRTAGKKIFPLCLDMSVGGYVESGESYEEALNREAREELNLDVNKLSIRCLGHLTPQTYDVSSYMKVYEIKLDEIPDYNKNDFVEYYFLAPQTLLKRIADGEKVKSDLPKIVKIFYSR